MKHRVPSETDSMKYTKYKQVNNFHGSLKDPNHFKSYFKAEKQQD